MWVESSWAYRRWVSPSASRTPAAIAVPLLLLLALCAALVADAWRDGGWLDGPLVVTPAVAGLWLGGRAHGDARSCGVLGQQAFHEWL